MKYWSKSALSIYRYLETMSNTIDKIVLNTGKTSNNITLQKYQTTGYQTTKIIELIDRKRKMINLKLAVEEGLSKISKEDRRILTLVYIDGVKSEMVAQLIGCSLRTFFRKKLNAMNQFMLALEVAGFDETFFMGEYSREGWIMPVYEENLIKGNNTEEILDKLLIKRVFDEVSNIDIGCSMYL